MTEFLLEPVQNLAECQTGADFFAGQGDLTQEYFVYYGLLSMDKAIDSKEMSQRIIMVTGG